MCVRRLHGCMDVRMMKNTPHNLPNISTTNRACAWHEARIQRQWFSLLQRKYPGIRKYPDNLPHPPTHWELPRFALLAFAHARAHTCNINLSIFTTSVQRNLERKRLHSSSSTACCIVPITELHRARRSSSSKQQANKNTLVPKHTRYHTHPRPLLYGDGKQTKRRLGFDGSTTGRSLGGKKKERKPTNASILVRI